MFASKLNASGSAAEALAPTTANDPESRARRLQRRAEREAVARHEAERLLEKKSLELFAANQRLARLNADLERRVEARTRQLDEARKAAVELGSTDYLTSIANRFEYSRSLERSLARSAGNGRATGLLLLDVDGFKLVNDTYGHAHGDQLLIALAGRLREMARSGELVARIGGDEFAVILEGPDAAALAQAAERFGSVFDEPVTILGVTLMVGGSMGLAISPDHCTTTVDLQRFADLALYKCKKEGRGRLAVFEKQLLQAYEFRQRIEAEFRGALSLNTIELHYQPIVCLKTGLIHSVESLARWADSSGAAISPDYFIPLAEQCGVIREVGLNLLEKALLDTREWIAEGHIANVSFNVSPLELLDEDFSEFVRASIDRAGVRPSHLVLEITEGAVLRNVRQAQRVMNRLRKLGVEFALDDFGCGYSNLSSLSQLPISTLKTDRSLLVDADRDKAARIILRNVIGLCKDLGIRSISEGAETAEQISLLRDMDCDAVQGFASGRPAPAGELARSILAQQDRRSPTIRKRAGSPLRPR